MKTKNEDPNYHPIQFALNRAVFHKELTDAEADKGIAEYNALVAVAEAANDLANDLQIYFDALVGKNDQLHPAWRLEQVAKSLRIYQSEQASSPIKSGRPDSNLLKSPTPS